MLDPFSRDAHALPVGSNAVNVELLQLWVPGKPRPKGSWTPMVLCLEHNISGCRHCPAAATRVHMENPAASSWEHVVAVAADMSYRRIERTREAYLGPVSIVNTFYFKQPRSGGDFGSAKAIGDGDKLERAILDALTKARVWGDDRQVVQSQWFKRWVPEDGDHGVLSIVEGLI